jgi:ribonucleoside-triphosphate reductase
MQICDLCGVEIQEADLGEGVELQGGKCLEYNTDNGKEYVARCDGCFLKDQSLSKKQKCEVFSRVCGYMRPVQNWNKAKVEEYKQRINFKMTEETPTVEVVIDPTVETVEVVEEKTTPEQEVVA